MQSLIQILCRNLALAIESSQNPGMFSGLTRELDNEDFKLEFLGIYLEKLKSAAVIHSEFSDGLQGGRAAATSLVNQICSCLFSREQA